MAEKRKARKKQAMEDMEEKMVLDKTHKSILHWVRKNVGVKKTKFEHSHIVQYFNSGKAIDALVNDSPWSKAHAKEGADFIIETRPHAMAALNELLRHKMFHRARKIPVAEKEKKKKKDEAVTQEPKPDAAAATEDEKNGKPRKRKGAVKAEEEKLEREKKKRKIRLEMHNEQIIVDGNEAYVWLYDPTPWYYYLAGSAIVLGIIAVCLFPLWPAEMRQGVYYLSVAAAGFLVFIIVLAIIKYIIFTILFIGSGFKLKFWIFPNLTEDVGFFESFVPCYVYTYDGPVKEHDSDEEESSSDEEEEGNKKEEERAGDGDGEGSETGRDEPGTGSQADQVSDDSGGSSKEFEIIDDKEAAASQ